tara:strand:- start:886 stop:1227 length:342 start_codon:yes stop_codon:yes gene_type:complete
MPAAVGVNSFDRLCQFKVLDQVSEGKLIKGWPCGAGDVQGVDPWSKLVARKSTEKPFLRAMPMRNQNSIFQEAADLWIQGEEGRGPGKVLKGNTVYLSSRPGNGLIGRQVGAE